MFCAIKNLSWHLSRDRTLFSLVKGTSNWNENLELILKLTRFVQNILNYLVVIHKQLSWIPENMTVTNSFRSKSIFHVHYFWWKKMVMPLFWKLLQAVLKPYFYYLGATLWSRDSGNDFCLFSFLEKKVTSFLVFPKRKTRYNQKRG